jgi:hypothetical protein
LACKVGAHHQSLHSQPAAPCNTVSAALTSFISCLD